MDGVDDLGEVGHFEPPLWIWAHAGLFSKRHSDSLRTTATPELGRCTEGFLRSALCPLLGVKRTSLMHAPMSAFDPERTSKAKQRIVLDPNLGTGTVLGEQARPARRDRGRSLVL